MERILHRLRACRRSITGKERGSILPYLTLAAGALAVLALTFMVGLGKVTLFRRDASGAADAAALAAAGAWADSLESAYNNAYRAGDSNGLWSGIGRGLGSYAGLEAKNAADKYASRNNATVTAYSVDPAHRTVTVTVETNSSIEGVDKKMTATSTAEIVLEDGVCLNGGKVPRRLPHQLLHHHSLAERLPRRPSKRLMEWLRTQVSQHASSTTNLWQRSEAPAPPVDVVCGREVFSSARKSNSQGTPQG